MRRSWFYRKRSVILAEGEYLRFIRRGEWEYVKRTNCTGIVVVLALTPEKKVVLTEQYRPPVNKNVVEFPAGLVNDETKRESLITAARRELLEEAGYKAKKMTFVARGPVSGGLTSDLIYIFCAKGLTKVGKGGGDFTESLIVHEVPFDKVIPWLRKKEKKGCLVDPKVYAGMYFLNDRSLNVP